MKDLPNLYYFNPTCELEIANGTLSYQPTKILKKFQNDIEILPLFLAKKNDIIIVEQIPSKAHQNYLTNLGFTLPQFLKFDNSFNIELNKIKTWGWSQITHKVFSSQKENCCSNFKNNPCFNWDEQTKKVYSKSSSTAIMQKIEDMRNYLGKKNLPYICTDVERIKKQLAQENSIVLKSPFSSSGRGVQILRKNELNEYNLQWINSTLKTQKEIVVEKLFDRVVDFAFQFEIKEGQIHYLGNSFFKVNGSGSYEGNYIGDYSKLINPNFYKIIKKLEHETVENLKQALKNSIYTRHYEGNIGVDAFLYKNKNGELKINPCIEINCRQNMGQLAIELSKRLDPNSYGEFNIYFSKNCDYKNFVKEQTENHPTELVDGKIKSGFVSLSEPKADSKFGLWMKIKN